VLNHAPHTDGTTETRLCISRPLTMQPALLRANMSLGTNIDIRKPHLTINIY